MADDSDDKTFEATEKKKQDAAKKGDVLRSKELATVATMATGGLMLVMVGPWLFGAMESVALSAFRFDAAALERKGSKINPLSGLKRIFGAQGLI